MLKGCAIIAALFLTGVALVIGGFVYEVMYAGLQYQDPTPQLPADYARHERIARMLEVSGVAVAFSAVFGGAAWGFYKRMTSKEEPYQPRPD